MSGKKVILIVAVLAVGVWFVVGLMTTRGGASAPVDVNGLPTPPSTVFSVSQGANTFYLDTYQQQGRSFILTDFYAYVDGKWKQQNGPMILNETKGLIDVRRLK